MITKISLLLRSIKSKIVNVFSVYFCGYKFNRDVSSSSLATQFDITVFALTPLLRYCVDDVK